MDYELLLLLLPVGIFLWWAAFYATKQMRIGKNKEREERAKYLLEAAENETHPTTEATTEKQEAH